MAKVEYDMKDLERWQVILTRAPAVTRKGARAMVSKGSLNIKNQARRLAPKGPHTPYYEQSINYDITETPVYVEGEIGPVEGRRQRGLGNLLEYGSAHNPPHPHHEPALDEEEPRFYAAVEALATAAFDG